MLAYNLIRTTIEQRSISFNSAFQTLKAFQRVIAIQGQRNSVVRMNLYQQLLDAIAAHQVADPSAPEQLLSLVYGELRELTAAKLGTNGNPQQVWRERAPEVAEVEVTAVILAGF